MMDKETIKEFLRPDKRKVGITIVLFLLVFIGLWAVSPGPSPGGGLPGSVPGGIFSIFFSLVTAPLLFIPIRIVGFLQLAYTSSSIGLVIFTVIEIYIVACLVTFIYDKFKPKK